MRNRYTEPTAIVFICITLLASACSSQQTRQQNAGQVTPSSAVREQYQQALSLMQRSQWDQAIEQLQAITRQNDALSGPYLNLGIAYARKGDSESAKQALLQSIERNKINPLAFNQLGILYRQAGDFEEAHRMYDSALKVSPDYADTHWNIGILFDLYLHEPGRALEHYERYQRLTGSSDPQLLLWIAELKQRTQTKPLVAGADKR